MPESGCFVSKAIGEWLKSCTRKGKISRNTIAVGLVILDKLRASPILKRQDVLSEGGEIAGARSALENVLQKYGLPSTFLKEVTTRQASQDGQRLLESLQFGAVLSRLPETERQQQIQDGINILKDLALQWLSRQHIKLECPANCSPASWIATILSEAKGKSGGKVEQHLVGAKLQTRHPNIPIPNHPGHAGDVQTGRTGDFVIGTTSFHVTAAPGSGVIEKCSRNLRQNLHPVLLVPRENLSKARHLAEDKGIAENVTIIAIEDYLAANIIELAEGQQSNFSTVIRKILGTYNERLLAVETDPSLKIEVV
jgi:hypothetical protein